MGDWPFTPPLATMEARVRETFPTPPGFAYEPKWDGFRALAWCGPAPRLDSRNERPLLRYFPELTESLQSLPPGTVLDGEIIVVQDGSLDFDALQNRLHPAASRVTMLAAATPAEFVAFDVLAVAGEDVRDEPFSARRQRLESVMRTAPVGWHLTPSTENLTLAERWFDEFESAGCDGIIAKRLDLAYKSGERAMFKIKHRRDADVVIGGYRIHKDGDKIGSLLLGLYTGDGELHFIGHCSGFGDTDRVEILKLLEPLRQEDSFGEDVRRPGAESRWSAGKDLSWVPVRPELVLQVSYDQLTGGRFRHATRFERWRPDKNPEDCSFDQLVRPAGPDFRAVVAR